MRERQAVALKVIYQRPKLWGWQLLFAAKAEGKEGGTQPRLCFLGMSKRQE